MKDSVEDNDWRVVAGSFGVRIFGRAALRRLDMLGRSWDKRWPRFIPLNANARAIRCAVGTIDSKGPGVHATGKMPFTHFSLLATIRPAFFEPGRVPATCAAVAKGWAMRR
jgi:hypothetical protein